MKTRGRTAIALAILAAAACRKSPERSASLAAKEGSAASPASASASTNAANAASASASTAATTCAPLPVDAFTLPPLDTSVIAAPLPEIVPPPPDAPSLDRLYGKLVALAAKNAKGHVRIAFYGDSNMTMDWITGGLRRALQSKLGDGGHGFVAGGKPWGWYTHMDVRHGTDSDARWRYFARSTHEAPDRHYGFANIAAQSLTGNAVSFAQTAPDDAPVGTRASEVEVFWLRQPDGGSFEILANGASAARVDTKGAYGPGFTKLHFADGPLKIENRVAGGLPVRIFGTVLERDPKTTPGVVVDSLGCGALNFEQMTRVDDGTRSPQIAERDYDLVVFLIGTNMFAPTLHQQWIHQVFGSLRKNAPNLPLMLMSPPDHEDGKAAPHTDTRIVALVKQWKEIAAAEGAAYWDFWSAMGGDASMRALAEKKLASWDLVHFTQGGGTLMGQRFAHVLMDATARWLAAHPDAPCRAASPAAP